MKRTTALFLIVILATLLVEVSQAQGNSDWEILNPENPPEPMFGHTLVQVSPNVVLAFGGKRSQTFSNDVYEFSNGQWNRIEITGISPAARSEHAAWVYKGQMYIFGGRNATEVFGDLWRYDPGLRTWEEIIPVLDSAQNESPNFAPKPRGFEDNWGQLFLALRPCASPSPRYGHVVDITEDGKVYISGGKYGSGVEMQDAWVYDILTNLWEQKSDAPFAFSGAGGAVYNHHILFFAAQPGSDETKIVSYYPPSDYWYVRPYPPDALRPPALKGAAFASDGYKVWMLGGRLNDGTFSAALWEYYMGSGRWKEITTTDLVMASLEAAGMTPLQGYFENASQPHSSHQSTLWPSVETPQTWSQSSDAGLSGVLVFGGLLSTGEYTNTTAIYHATFGIEGLLQPGYATTLSYSDRQHITTTIQMPGGLVTETTILALTASPKITHTMPISRIVPGGLFDLAALTYPLGEPIPGFELSHPITVTLDYNNLQFDKDSLWLARWNGTQWLDAAESCSPASRYERDFDENRLTLPICQLGEFALVGARRYAIYLPVVMRQ